MKRIKRTTVRHMNSDKPNQYNYLCSVGPAHDPHKDIVCIIIHIIPGKVTT